MSPNLIYHSFGKDLMQKKYILESRKLDIKHLQSNQTLTFRICDIGTCIEQFSGRAGGQTQKKETKNFDYTWFRDPEFSV